MFLAPAICFAQSDIFHSESTFDLAISKFFKELNIKSVSLIQRNIQEDNVLHLKYTFLLHIHLKEQARGSKDSVGWSESLHFAPP